MTKQTDESQKRSRDLTPLWLRYIIIFVFGAVLAWLLIPPLKVVLILIFLSFLLSIILDPVITHIERSGTNRITGIAIVFAGFFLTIYLIMVFIYPSVNKELVSLLDFFQAEKINEFSAKITEFTQKNLPFLPADEIVVKFKESVTSLLSGSISFLLNLFSVFSYIIFIPLFTFFLLKDWRNLKKYTVSLIPNRYFEMYLNLLYKINLQLGSYLRGQLIEITLIGLLAVIGLLVLDVKYAVVLGIFAGIANIVPFIGPIIGAVPAVIIALIDTGSSSSAVLIALLFVLVQLVDNIFVKPTVVARSVDLHPLLVIFVVIAGGQFFGIIGMVLVVPATAVAKAVITELQWNFKHYQLR